MNPMSILPSKARGLSMTAAGAVFIVERKQVLIRLAKLIRRNEHVPFLNLSIPESLFVTVPRSTFRKLITR